jgi:hypothetical protein
MDLGFSELNHEGIMLIATTYTSVEVHRHFAGTRCFQLSAL